MYLQGGMMYGRRVEGTQANTRITKEKILTAKVAQSCLAARRPRATLLFGRGLLFTHCPVGCLL